MCPSTHMVLVINNLYNIADNNNYSKEFNINFMINAIILPAEN